MDENGTTLGSAIVMAIATAIAIGVVAMMAGGLLAMLVVVAIVGYAWQAST